MGSSSTSTQAPQKKRTKATLLIWLEFIPFWFLYQAIRLMPLKMAYFFDRMLFSILFYIDRKHRTRSISHVLHAGIVKTPAEANKIAKEAFISFAKLLVEIIKMDQSFKPEMITFSSSPESYARTFGDRKTNVIVLTAHYGNWELAGSFWATLSGYPMVSIMRPFSNPLIGKYILRGREAGNHQSISKDGGMRGLLRALKDGKTIAILADQHAGLKEGGIETLFFGQPCRTHTSPALLHLRTGVPIVPQLTRRLDDDGHFEFIMGDLIEYKPTDDKEKDLKIVTQMYTTALEKMIAKDPTQWLWAHRRWLNINRKR